MGFDNFWAKCLNCVVSGRAMASRRMIAPAVQTNSSYCPYAALPMGSETFASIPEKPASRERARAGVFPDAVKRPLPRGWRGGAVVIGDRMGGANL